MYADKTNTWLTNRILIKIFYKIHMRIQSLQTYKVLQQIKYYNAYTIILIYNINPDGVNMDHFSKSGCEKGTGELSWGWIDAESWRYNKTVAGKSCSC